MANQELLEYIKKARTVGQTDEQMKTDLLTAGWIESDIQEGLNPIPNQNKPIKKSNAPVIIAIVVGVLLFIIMIGGILAGIVLTSLNGAKNKAKKASFRSIIVSINPDARQCADQSSINTINPGIGQNICNDISISNEKYPSLGQGICDDNTYSVIAEDPNKTDGQYKYTASCKIKGKNSEIICSQNGCN